MSSIETGELAPLESLAIGIDALVDIPLPIAEQATGPENAPGLSPSDARIVIIDDEPINIDLLRLYLQEGGYEQFTTTEDSTVAMEIVRVEQPDVILLDLMMPRVNGFDILREIRNDENLRHTPVIILTASNNPESKLQALEMGVNEFLAKPVDPSELLLRLRNTLAAKALRDHLQNYSSRLEGEVRQRTSELDAARQEVMHCLARAAEFRDDDTGRHVLRVGRYVAVIAQEMGFDAERVEMLEQAAQLHDVGKIGIPDSILLKPGKLEESEFELMKNHCSFGKKIIRPMIDDDWKAIRRHTEIGAALFGIASSPIMKLAAIIAESHHERWNGSGYPRGLKGEQIPIEGRITAVADVYDALSTRRPYKPAFSEDKCFSILEEGRGRHFDPEILDAFFRSAEAILRVQNDFADP
ncbi:MAG: response regulator [Pirellulaceae bacterium]|nr:response regulator [Pirellulaceae bacterium]